VATVARNEIAVGSGRSANDIVRDSNHSDSPGVWHLDGAAAIGANIVCPNDVLPKVCRKMPKYENPFMTSPCTVEIPPLSTNPLTLEAPAKAPFNS